MKSSIERHLKRNLSKGESERRRPPGLLGHRWLLITCLGFFTILFASGALLFSTTAGAQPPLVGDYLLIKKYPDQQTIQRGEDAKFTIIVSNIDPQVDLTDVVVQDLIAPACGREIGDLPANSNFPTYNCYLQDVQEPVVNWAIVKGVNPADGQSDQARDSAVVDILDAEITIEATPTVTPSPGGLVNFSVNIRNTGSVTVDLRSLTSPQLGNLVDPGNALLSENECTQVMRSPLTIPIGKSADCSFRSEISGGVGKHPVEIEATVQDAAGNTATRSASKSIELTSPIRHVTYLPVSTAQMDEPNDTCLDAFPLHTAVTYHFFPDDRDDWYFFELGQSEEVLVELLDFFPRLGQIVVYQGAECRSLTILRNNGNDQDAKPVPLGIQPSGRYYILVVNAGKPNNQVPYQLTVRIQ